MSNHERPDQSDGEATPPSFSWTSLKRFSFSSSTPPDTTIEADGVPPTDDVANGARLNSIAEASNENSRTTTRRASAASEVAQNRWWLWTSTTRHTHTTKEQVYPNDNEPTTELTPVDVVTEEWAWSRRISEILWSPAAKNETAPLLANGQNKSVYDTKSNEPAILTSQSSWWWPFSWSSSNPTVDDEDTDEYDNQIENNAELFRKAKQAIESSKDSSHYAIKFSSVLKNYELAVSGTQTETQPVKYRTKRRPLTPNEVQENTIVIVTPKPIEEPVNKAISTPVAPGARQVEDQPESTLVGANQKSRSVTPPQTQTQTENLKATGTTSSSASSIKSTRKSPEPAKKYNKPSIVPDITENFRNITLVTKIRLLGQHVLYHQHSSERHLYRIGEQRVKTRKQKQIKKIVIIGIHGFLPIKMVRTLIGQSTGSSIKFVDIASKAMKTWLKQQNERRYEEDEYDIETIALEGEGRIDERVDKLFKLLDNWRDVINNSDFVFMVSHSQGVPVGIQLLTKILTSEHYHLKKKKIGFLSMSGVIYGPFNGLDSKLVIRAFTANENHIINEIFEFQKVGTPKNVQLNKNLKFLIENNVKIILSGSINDQFIPIYSSLGCNYYHSNIYRVLSVGDTNHIPKFIITLFKIVLMMKNLGYSDHNIIRDLSDRCQGTNNNEGGFGRIYENEDVYLDAIKFSLETTSLIQEKELINESSLSSNIGDGQGIGNGKNRTSSLSISIFAPNETAVGINSNNTTNPATGANNVSNNNGIIMTTNTINNLYHLPWNVRGLIQDLTKIKNIGNINLIRELLEDYQNWGNLSKQWKDIKYCFQAFEDVTLEDFMI